MKSEKKIPEMNTIGLLRSEATGIEEIMYPLDRQSQEILGGRVGNFVTRRTPQDAFCASSCAF
jgi:hypothetical protein